jgi:hypothetical protein
LPIFQPAESFPLKSEVKTSSEEGDGTKTNRRGRRKVADFMGGV